MEHNLKNLWFTISCTCNLCNIIHQHYFNKKIEINTKKLRHIVRHGKCVWKATESSDNSSSCWIKAKSLAADWGGICGIKNIQNSREFSSSPVIRILYFHCKGHGLIAAWGTKMLHAVQCSQKWINKTNKKKTHKTPAIWKIWLMAITHTCRV